MRPFFPLLFFFSLGICHELHNQHQPKSTAFKEVTEDSIKACLFNLLALGEIRESEELLSFYRENFSEKNLCDEEDLLIKEGGAKEYTTFFTDKSIPHPERLAIKRFLLPSEEPVREQLDALFNKTRAIFDENFFLEAGFIPLLPIRKDKIVIAKHPLLKGFIVKTYLDKYPVNKSHDPDWLWLSRRCSLAKKIGKAIEKMHLKNYIVPKKWLYPLPKQSTLSPQGERVNALLIEEEMPLLSTLENQSAWRNISCEALDELAEIMLHAGGQSYRPDNVWMTEDGRFAFIDTEYPHLAPRFFEILPYLSDEKKEYWKCMIMSKIFSRVN